MIKLTRKPVKVLLIKAACVLTKSGLRENGRCHESKHMTPGRHTLSVSSLTELGKLENSEGKKNVAKLETKK